jgi:hypothetical protein
MRAHAFEAFRAANPLAQNAAQRRVVLHDGNGDVHGLYFSPDALGKIVVSFHDTPPLVIKLTIALKTNDSKRKPAHKKNGPGGNHPARWSKSKE